MNDSNLYDVAILGTGPAGLQAAIHAARKKAKVLMLGKEASSSLFHAHIENFCCIFKITGEEMLRVGRQQALQFGAEILNEDVLQARPQEHLFEIKTESGRQLVTKALVVATGTKRNRLGVAGEKQLLGKGVSYCVDCDANFFRNENVAVVGGESAAVSGAIELSHTAKSVHLICDRLKVVEALKDELRNSPVSVFQGSVVKEIIGTDSVEGLRLDDGRRIEVTGVFIELGAKGLMELAAGLGIRLDDSGQYIRADKKQQTNVTGVYAAGDICGQPWQMAKAVGEGCVAGIEAAVYARKLKP